MEQNKLITKYGVPSTEGIMYMLYDLCHEGLTAEQLDYIQNGAADARCTLDNIRQTVVNVATGISEGNNMLSSANDATAFLYSLADHLAAVRQTMELAEMAEEEKKARQHGTK